MRRALPSTAASTAEFPVRPSEGNREHREQWALPSMVKVHGSGETRYRMDQGSDNTENGGVELVLSAVCTHTFT